MSTGNIDNAYRMFERSVRKNGVNLSSFDTLSLRTGDPFTLMKVLRALIFETYPQVSRLLLDKGCVQTCTDKKILNGLFDHLRENAKYSCPLTVDQFLSKQSFAEHKLLVIAAVSEWVDSCKEKPKAVAMHSESIFRNKLHVDHPDGTPQAFYKSRAGSAPRIKRDTSVPSTPASPKQLDLSNLQNMATPNVLLDEKSEIRMSTSSERRGKEKAPSSVDTEALVQRLFEDFETKLLGVIDSRIEKVSKDIDAKFTVLESRLKYIEGTLKSHQASTLSSPQAPSLPAAVVPSISLADRLAKSRASLIPSTGGAVADAQQSIDSTHE